VIAAHEFSDEAAATAALGDPQLAVRALAVGRAHGERWRARYATIHDAIAEAGIRYEVCERGGLTAGRCVLSEHHDVGDRVVIYADAVAHVGERIRALGVDGIFPPERMIDVAAAHELFHWIHRRGERGEIDAALGCVVRVWGIIPVRKRAFAAEEVAAHAFAASFHGLPHCATVLERLFEQDGRRATS
jgi:hypothetical protein